MNTSVSTAVGPSRGFLSSSKTRTLAMLIVTATGNDEKRFRDFQLSISEDGGSLVGTIIESSDKNNREDRLDVA